MANTDVEAEKYERETRQEKQRLYEKQLEDERLEKQRAEVEEQKKKEQQEKDRVQRLEDQANFLYEGAVGLYNQGAYQEAKDKFLEVTKVFPKYKASDDYLRKVDRKIEEQAKDIIKRVGELGVHLKRYEEYHGKLGVSLGTVVNHYENSGKEFKKLDKDVMRITGEAPGLEVPMLERPDME